MNDLEDHGLPLVALKEQRRELVISLLGRIGPISKTALNDLATIQSAINAVESVISDLDQEQNGFYGVFSSAITPAIKTYGASVSTLLKERRKR